MDHWTSMGQSLQQPGVAEANQVKPENRLAELISSGRMNSRVACYYFCGKVLGENDKDFSERKSNALKFLKSYLKKLTSKEPDDSLLISTYENCLSMWNQNFHRSMYDARFIANHPTQSELKSFGLEEEPGRKTKEWAGKLKRRKKWVAFAGGIFLSISVAAAAGGVLLESKFPGGISGAFNLLGAISSNEQAGSMINAAIGGAVPEQDSISQAEFDALLGAVNAVADSGNVQRESSDTDNSIQGSDVSGNVDPAEMAPSIEGGISGGSGNSTEDEVVAPATQPSVPVPPQIPQASPTELVAATSVPTMTPTSTPSSSTQVPTATPSPTSTLTPSQTPTFPPVPSETPTPVGTGLPLESTVAPIQDSSEQSRSGNSGGGNTSGGQGVSFNGDNPIPSPASTVTPVSAVLTGVPTTQSISATETPTTTPSPTATSTMLPTLTQTPALSPIEVSVGGGTGGINPPMPETGGEVEMQRTYNPYIYLRDSILAKLDAVETMAESTGTIESLRLVIDGLREQIRDREKIVIDLVITDKTVYSRDEPDNPHVYFADGQEHIGNSDGVLQIIFQESGVYIIFLGRDLPAYYLIDGELGDLTTLEMLGSPLPGNPRNPDGTIKTHSDDVTKVLTSLTGIDANIGLKLSLGEVNKLAGLLFPEGVEIVVDRGIQNNRVNFEPGVPQLLEGEDLVSLITQRKGSIGTETLSTYNRGSAMLREILSNPVNINNITSSMQVSSFWQGLFSQNLGDDVYSFQVHGGPQANFLYSIMGMVSDSNFGAEFFGLLANAAVSGNLHIITVNPPSPGTDPLAAYQAQVASALNGG
ncbi:MAG: hypothetical protein JNK26_04985 [Candidatus Doudnabacteria bacterium]|nr:hypothetical protein [Candidatus Doudnabacteria bacterium]